MSKSDAKEKTTVLKAPDPHAKSDAQHIGGSRFDKVNEELITQAVYSLWLHNCDAENKTWKQQACLEAMAGISPRDELEGMLAAQMIACHSAAMECFRRAMIKDQTFEGRQQNLNFANKLSRTYALHMEALDKHRGKGQQKVMVEHVHVHQGGQAIVGNVATGGSTQNLEKQPHAQSGKLIAHSQEQALSSTLAPNGQAMPIAGNA
jgi:hypothetical protein